MKEEMKKHSADLPNNCSLTAITEDHQKGLLQNGKDLLRRYPAETMNAFFGLAGLCIAASALRHKVFFKPGIPMDAQALKKIYHEGLLDVGLGTMTLASGAVSALVEEKARDPDEPKPTTTVEKVKDFVQ